MAEKQFQLAANGQQLQQADVNQLGETSGLADDRVFAELLQITPYDGVTVGKGVLQPARAALVAPAGATGSVFVNPFRAFIGSRTVEGTEALEFVRDVRSCLSVAEGATASQATVALTANASGDPRWDLIYASIAVDANSATTTRKVKDTVTKVVTSTAVVLNVIQTMAIGVVVGTPGAVPAFPTLPADAGSTYYVPLAYVRVPDGFTAASTVAKADVNTVAPVLGLARSTGSANLRPANQNSDEGGVGITGAGTSAVNGVLAWTGTAGVRPGVYMPPTMSGMESLLIAIDVGNASSANWSHTHTSVVDDSRDWRNRIFKWHAMVGRGATACGRFPWNTAAVGTLFAPWSLGGGPTVNDAPMPGYARDATYAVHVSGMGSSFGTGGTSSVVGVVAASGAGSVSVPANNYNVATYAMAPATGVYLYVDDTTGALHVGIAGVPLTSVFFWLDASGPYQNGKL